MGTILRDVDGQSGRLKWSHSMHAQVLASPAIGRDGAVQVGTTQATDFLPIALISARY